MKNTTFFIVAVLIIIYHISNAQIPDTIISKGNSIVCTTGKILNINLDTVIHFQPDRKIISTSLLIDSNFRFHNKIGLKTNRAHPKFILPVKLTDGSSDENFYTITAYVDHDSLNPGHLKDYMCGDLTYDYTGYNHTGTDFFPWPFPWYKMYNDEVEIVAAAPGILYYKQDGNFDQHCEENTEPWNGVAVLHEDGSTAWYIHMKMNSITQKNVGEEISQGEYLGMVGSSGSSKTPHLHMEVFDSNGNLIDPFYGPCNNSISDSWWIDQPAYKKPSVNKISTNVHLPFFGNCPDEEITNEADIFNLGDTVYLLSYFKNISLNDTVKISIFRPDNSVFMEWSWYCPWTFYPASWVYFYFVPVAVETGLWNYRLTYKSIDYNCEFEIKDPQGIQVQMNQTAVRLFPNPTHGWTEVICNDPFLRIIKAEIITPLGGIFPVEFSHSSKSDFQLYLGDLDPGVYFLKLHSQLKTQIIKVIKY